MKEIDIRVTTYDPEIVPSGYYDDPYDTAVMVVVENGTGDWTSIFEHEEVVRALQQRIVYLENCYQEVLDIVTG